MRSFSHTSSPVGSMPVGWLPHPLRPARFGSHSVQSRPAFTQEHVDFGSFEHRPSLVQSQHGLAEVGPRWRLVRLRGRDSAVGASRLPRRDLVAVRGDELGPAKLGRGRPLSQFPTGSSVAAKLVYTILVLGI